MAKVFDAIVNSRLITSVVPDVEQAWAQKGRGCVEHIQTLRLIQVEVTRSTKRPLYTVFVDFRKAYDLVPRSQFAALLARLGCGNRMLKSRRL